MEIQEWQLDMFRIMNDLTGKVSGLERSFLHVNEKISCIQKDFKEFKASIQSGDVHGDLFNMNYRLQELENQKASQKKVYFTLFAAFLAGLVNVGVIIFQLKILG